MAGVAVYLAAAPASYVTGAVIPVDGGISLTSPPVTADVDLDLRGRRCVSTGRSSTSRCAGGLRPVTGDRVRGRVVDTLVCLSDGTTSLYFSHGAGSSAAASTFRVAERRRGSRRDTGALDVSGRTPAVDLPAEVTSSCARHAVWSAAGERREDDLGEGRHLESSVFDARTASSD